jgi:hypothetical protein
MTLDIASPAHPDVSGFDQIMAEEQRFGEPPGKHPVEDESLIKWGDGYLISHFKMR